MTRFSPKEPTKLELVEIWTTIAAKKYSIDKALISAIIEIESGGNPNAIGLYGEVGLMQLHPNTFPDGPVEIAKNIMTGVSYLASIKEKKSPKYGCHWPIFYNTGPNLELENPSDHSYFKKIKAIYSDICKGAT